MEILFTVLILILIVALSGAIMKIIPLNIPLPIIQIIIGGLIAWPNLGFHVELNPELFLVLFIPPLLFEDGRKMPLHEFMRAGREILSLALTLVLITVFGLGYMIHLLLPDMPLVVAIALAAILSPTDAVALSSIVGKGRLPRKMMRILEGEALMNDASALVSLKFAIAIAIGAMSLSTIQDYTTVGLTFLKMSVGGLITGVILTWIYIKFVQFLSKWQDDDPATQMLFLLLLPFFIYVITEHLGMSGILGAVASGMAIGYSGIFNTAPISMRLRANGVWSILEYLLNGIVFLLLGLQIPEIVRNALDKLATEQDMTLFTLISDVLIVYAAIMLLRFLWLLIMKGTNYVIKNKNPMIFMSFSIRDLLVLTFSGVRGTITLAAALSIPLIIEARYQIVFISIGVILLSLIVGILILPLLLRGFTIDLSPLIQEEKDAKIAMTEAAIKSVTVIEERILNNEKSTINAEILSQIAARVKQDSQRYNGLADHTEETEELELRIRLASLRAQRGELYHLRAIKKISNETCDKLVHEVDLAEALISGHSAKRIH